MPAVLLEIGYLTNMELGTNKKGRITGKHFQR